MQLGRYDRYRHSAYYTGLQRSGSSLLPGVFSPGMQAGDVPGGLELAAHLDLLFGHKGYQVVVGVAGIWI
jgi:hypothetical protein